MDWLVRGKLLVHRAVLHSFGNTLCVSEVEADTVQGKLATMGKWNLPALWAEK